MPSTEFLVTAMIVVLLPGTGVIYTVSTGLVQGVRASIAAASGCTLGIVPHIIASVTGLAALLHVSALAFNALKFAGVAYLLFLAWGMWREQGRIALDAEPSERGLARIATRGFLINILNPKLSMFFLAFLPQFVSSSDGAVTLRMLSLGAIFMLLTFVVFVGYGVGAHSVRARVARSPRMLGHVQRGFALAFAGLAARLATAER